MAVGKSVMKNAKKHQGGSLSPMSGSREADIHISQCIKELENFRPKNTGQNGQIWRGITSLNPEYS